jgi:hypothetical protein
MLEVGMKKLLVVLLLAVAIAVPAYAAKVLPGAVLDWSMAADPDTYYGDGVSGMYPGRPFDALSVDWRPSPPSGEWYPGSWLTRYYAGSNLPQIAPSDLGKYAWSMSVTQDSFDEATKTAVYKGTFYLFAPGYGFGKDEYLEKADVNLIANFNQQFTSCNFSGTFVYETGSRQPSGWSQAVDWSSVNPATVFQGVWNYIDDQAAYPHEIDKDYLSMRIYAVPEPSSLIAVFSGIAGLGAGIIRRRK